MPVAPEVIFQHPAALANVASWNATTYIFVVNVRAAITPSTAVQFTVKNVVAPSARNTSQAPMTSVAPDGGIVDGPNNVTMDAITAGALKGALSWSSAVKTPAVPSIVTLSFSTTGRVPVGGKIRVVLPDDGWTVVGGVPSATFAGSLSAVKGTVTWHASSRTVEITTAEAIIGHATAVVVKLDGFVSPPHVTPSGTAVLSTHVADGGIIHIHLAALSGI